MSIVHTAYAVPLLFWQMWIFNPARVLYCFAHMWQHWASFKVITCNEWRITCTECLLWVYGVFDDIWSQPSLNRRYHTGNLTSLLVNIALEFFICNRILFEVSLSIMSIFFSSINNLELGFSQLFYLCSVCSWCKLETSIPSCAMVFFLEQFTAEKLLREPLVFQPNHMISPLQQALTYKRLYTGLPTAFEGINVNTVYLPPVIQYTAEILLMKSLQPFKATPLNESVLTFIEQTYTPKYIPFCIQKGSYLTNLVFIWYCPPPKSVYCLLLITSIFINIL